MSLSLNQPTPRLNDLLLRGGDDLSPELKEQALDDILAEFGSAPAKKAPAQTAPMPKPGFSTVPSGPLTPEAEAEAIRGSRSPSTEPLSPVTAAAPQSIPFPTASVQPDSAPKSNAAPAKSASPSLACCRSGSTGKSVQKSKKRKERQGIRSGKARCHGPRHSLG